MTTFPRVSPTLGITPFLPVTNYWFEYSICCCTWLMDHFRTFLCGFPNCLCFLSHCSPPTIGSIGHVIVGIQYFKGCHLGSLNMCMTVTVCQSLLGSVGFGFLFFVFTDLLLLCCSLDISVLCDLSVVHLSILFRWPASYGEIVSTHEDVFQIRQYVDICRGRCHQQPNDMPGSAWPNTPGKLSHQKSMWCRGCPDVAGIVR